MTYRISLDWRAMASRQTKLLVLFGLILVGLACSFMFADKASAHGYISSPASRTAQCAAGTNKDCGNVKYEPQSVEAKGNFPAAGPADGKIAGGGVFPELDAQTAERWTKVDMKGGLNSFTWTNTARHSTSAWNYFITKKGWDPNKPITRDQLESKPFCTVNGGNKQPDATVTHQCTVPSDRTGYYVILGVWEIADTGNAFYQAIDVNLTNGPVDPVTLPTIPAGVLCTSHTDSTITLGWTASTASAGIKQYEVSRGGQVIGTSTTPSYTDSGLPANTTYSYTVVAIDNSNNRSGASTPLSANTLPKATDPDTQAPTAPTNLASGSQTATGISLSWTASTDNVGVVKYEIYRGTTLAGTSTTTSFSDSGLTASTAYTYTVKALDAAGNRSAASAALTVSTKSTTPTTGTWDSTKAYVAGDKVTYNGVEYVANWWTQGEKPDSSAAWKPVTAGTIQAWSADKAYSGNDQVTYGGKTYKAQWWTKGDIPGSASVWVLVA